MSLTAFIQLFSAYLGAIGSINLLRSVAGKSDYTFYIESGGGFCGNKEDLLPLLQQHFHTVTGGIFFLASFITAVISIVLQPALDTYELVSATGTVCISTLAFVSLFPILSCLEKRHMAKKYAVIKEKLPEFSKRQMAEQGGAH